MRPQVRTPQPRHRGRTSPRYELREPAVRASRSPGAGVPSPGPHSPLPPPSPVLRSQPAGPVGAAARCWGPGAAPVLTPWSRRRLRRGRGNGGAGPAAAGVPALRARRAAASPAGLRDAQGCRDRAGAPASLPHSSVCRARPATAAAHQPASGRAGVSSAPAGPRWVPARHRRHPSPGLGDPRGCGSCWGSRRGSWLCGVRCGAGWRGCIHSLSMEEAPVSV